MQKLKISAFSTGQNKQSNQNNRAEKQSWGRHEVSLYQAVYKFYFNFF